MKRYLNFSLAYAIAAMAGGVFYREFTKWNKFSGTTTLGKVHAHLFFLGMMMFMVVAAFAKNYDLQKQKTFRIFLYVYNIGVPLTVIMMMIRGITQVLNLSLSSAMDAAISGTAGIGHILVSIGIILFITTLKNIKELKVPY